jgi:DNA-binding GntR family transcriptional regulator
VASRLSGGDRGEHPRRASESNKLLRRGSGEQAAAYIRQLIFEGELGPGARVPQEEIAQALGISRVPVREALVALEKEGRVTIELHRGAFVTALTEQSVRDNQDLVGLINDFLIQRAAQRATPELLASLRAVQADIDRTQDPIAMRHLMDEWTTLIEESGTAPRTARVLSGLRDLVVENFYEVVPGAMQAFRKGSAAVTNAISKGDPEAAIRASQAMQAGGNKCVIEFYRASNLFDQPDQPGATDSIAL